MREEFRQVKLNKLSHLEVLKMQLRYPREKQALHVPSNKEMHKYPERHLLIIPDRSNQRARYKVHPLTVSDLRYRICYRLEHPLQLFLPLLCLHPLTSVRSL